jgi:hypothetical protein
MQVYRYNMKSTSPSPIGLTDTKAWFYRYKWKGELGEEKFVPLNPPWSGASVGDILEFVMDGRSLGRVTVLRVEYPNAPYGVEEIWYDSSQIQEPVSWLTRFRSFLRGLGGSSRG